MLGNSRYRLSLLLLMGMLFTLSMVAAQSTSPAAGYSATVPAAPLSVGQTGSVVIQVQTGGHAINGAEIHLDFNPAIIRIDAVTPGLTLPLALVAPAFSNTAGTMDYAAGTVSNFPTSAFDLLTVQFTALAPGATTLRIPLADVPRRSDITAGTGSVFNLTAPLDLGTINVASAQPPTLPPTTVVPTAEPTVVPTSEPTLPPTPTGPGLKLALSPAAPVAGDLLTVQVIADQVVGLYGLETMCTVDPASVTGGALGAGEVFTTSNSFVVDGGYQPSGSWRVAASLLNPAPSFDSTGTAYSLLYPLNSVSEFNITCQALAVDRNGQTVGSASLSVSVDIGGPVVTPDPTVEPTIQPTTEPTIQPTVEPTIPPTATPEPTATVQPTLAPVVGSIQGVVNFQRRSDHSGIMLTVLAGGPSGTTFAQAQTGADGSFRFDNVPAGTYSIQFFGTSHLGAVYTFNVDAAGVVLNTVTLLAGDTDGNNTIDLADAALIGANLQQTAPPAPDAADLNADGLINIVDLVLVGGNFGTTGPVVIGP